MPLERVDYDGRLHRVYQQGRALSAETLATWMATFAPFVAAPPGVGLPRIVDVGSGTGRFSPALAEAFGSMVVGVEPSSEMRRIAATDAAHPQVRYVGGTAEALPTRSGCIDAALLFLSWHHVRDRKAAAAELRRVVREGGVVLLRTSFADRMPDLWWYDAFPNARRVDASMYPTLDETVDLFAEAHWQVRELRRVDIPLAANPAESLAKLRLRAISTFEHLDETEIVHGFAELARLVGEMAPEPLRADLDLLVLG